MLYVIDTWFCTLNNLEAYVFTLKVQKSSKILSIVFKHTLIVNGWKFGVEWIRFYEFLEDKSKKMVNVEV